MERNQKPSPPLTPPKTKTELKGHSPPPGEKTVSWDHQRAAFNFAINRTQTMLHMDMGTGKSKIIVDIACAKARLWANVRPNDPRYRERPFRVLILCPKSVVPVWPSQFDAHAHGDITYHVLTPRGSVSQKAELVRGFLDTEIFKRAHDLQVVVLNYESARGGSLGWDKATQKKGVLLSNAWDLVVLDESHRIKKPSGPTSLFTRRLRTCSVQRICMSGTPMPNGPLGLWNQFLFLNPRVLGESFVRFRSEHAIMGGPTGQWVQGFKNFDVLGRKVGPHVFHCDDSVTSLPEITFQDRVCELSKGERKHYDEMERTFITEVKDGTVTATNALSKLLRLQQISSGFLPGAEDTNVKVGDSREKLLKDILQDIPAEEPVVVFCRFVRDLARARSVLEKSGRIVDELSGARNDIGARWEGSSTGAVVQIQSGNLGVDLTKSRIEIFYTPTFSLGDYKQAVKRTHRPGQERSCSVIHMVARDTVDERVYAALSKKEDVVRAVVNSFKGDKA